MRKMVLWMELTKSAVKRIALGSYTLSLYDANPTRECGASDIRREVMFGVIVMSASAVCDALLAAFSYRGTMDDDRPRRHIG